MTKFQELMKKSLLFIQLSLLFVSCSPQNTSVNNQNLYKQEAASQKGYTSSCSDGYEILSYSEQYLNIAKNINMEMVKGDYDDAMQLLQIGVNLAEELYDLDVSEDYKTAKEYLYTGMYYDLQSFAMIVDGKSLEDAEDTMNEGMMYMIAFIEEMKKLGHDIDF